MSAPVITTFAATPNPATPGTQVRLWIDGYDPDNRVRRFRGIVANTETSAPEYVDLTISDAPLTYQVVEVDPATNQPLAVQPQISQDPNDPAVFYVTA